VAPVRKRLRKKLRVGDFREVGFEVRFRISDEVDEAGLGGFWDAFIGDAIEGGGLACGGGCGRKYDLFVFRPGRASATEEDRQAIGSWLERHAHVSDTHIGPLVDAWHV
jgi:uncharacterized protein YggL (DUF469 family)